MNNTLDIVIMSSLLIISSVLFSSYFIVKFYRNSIENEKVKKAIYGESE